MRLPVEAEAAALDLALGLAEDYLAQRCLVEDLVGRASASRHARMGGGRLI